MIRLHTADFLRSWRQLEADVPSAARQLLGQGAAYATALARATQAFKDRTGRLRGSIHREQRGPWRELVLAGGKGARYGLFVEDGTVPHVIEARRVKALHFVWNGVPVFFRRVHHPGTKPRHFMLDARNAAENQLPRFVENAFARLLH